MRASHLILAAVIGAVPAGPALAACDPGETVLVFSDAGPAQGTPRIEAARLLAERVGQELDGRLCIEIRTGAGEVDEAGGLAALADGSADLVALDAGTLGDLDAAYLVYDLPFVFDGIEAVLAFNASEAGQGLLDGLGAAGARGLAHWLEGFDQMTADRALARPEDAAGLTFAAGLSEVERAGFDALGTGYIEFTRAETYHALRDGVIEGQVGPWPGIAAMRLHEVQSHATETNHSVSVRLLAMSTAAWEWLATEDRHALAELAAEVAHERNRMVFELGAAAREALVAGGLSVTRLDVPGRALWRAHMAGVRAAFEQPIGQSVVAAAETANAR